MQRADQLVDRVVPAHILAHPGIVAVHEACGMHAAAVRIHRLMARHGLQRGMDLAGRDLAADADARRRAHGLAQFGDAAQSAAAAAFQGASAVFQPIEARLRDRGVQRDPGLVAHHVDQRELARGRDDAFAQREAQREVFQIDRRRHHHRERQAVVEQGNG